MFNNNPALAGVVSPKRQGNLLDLRNQTDENGIFEIAALPGPGIVAFRADAQHRIPVGPGRRSGPRAATVTATERPDEFVFS